MYSLTKEFLIRLMVVCFFGLVVANCGAQEPPALPRLPDPIDQAVIDGRLAITKTIPPSSAVDRIDYARPVRPTAVYDSHGAPVVPAPVPDEIAGDMLAINGPLKKLAARHNSKAAANLTPAPVQTPKPAPTPPPQTQQGYWQRSCNGSACYSTWVPASGTTTQQAQSQGRWRLFGRLRRW